MVARHAEPQASDLTSVPAEAGVAHLDQSGRPTGHRPGWCFCERMNRRRRGIIPGLRVQAKIFPVLNRCYPVIVSVAQCAWVLLSDAQSGLKKRMLTLGDLPAPANTRHLEIMREGHSVIHDSGPGEDGLAADAAPGQPAGGHGDGEYDLSAEDREWIKQRDILGLLFRTRAGSACRARLL